MIMSSYEKCGYYSDGECNICGMGISGEDTFCRLCKDNPNCYYKQLQRLKSSIKDKERASMKQVFIEFVVPEVVNGDYEKIYTEFEKKITALHGLTDDSFEVREFEVDEIPF